MPVRNISGAKSKQSEKSVTQASGNNTGSRPGNLMAAVGRAALEGYKTINWAAAKAREASKKSRSRHGPTNQAPESKTSNNKSKNTMTTRGALNAAPEPLASSNISVRDWCHNPAVKPPAPEAQPLSSTGSNHRLMGPTAESQPSGPGSSISASTGKICAGVGPTRSDISLASW